MKRVFGVKKNKEPPPSSGDASDRVNKRGESVDQKIEKLDAELTRYKERLKKTRPGPAQEAIKAGAMRIVKQKRMRVMFWYPWSPFEIFFEFYLRSFDEWIRGENADIYFG